MNVEDLKTWLNENLEHDIENAFFGSDFPDLNHYTEHPDWYNDSIGDFVKAMIANNITAKEVDSYGGEGQGDDYWTVVEFSSGDAKVHVKFDGWYQSYNGSEYTDWFFVNPKEVTVIRWFSEE